MKTALALVMIVLVGCGKEIDLSSDPVGLCVGNAQKMGAPYTEAVSYCQCFHLKKCKH